MQNLATFSAGLSKLNKLVLGISLLAFAFSYSKTGTLPPRSELLPDLLTEPLQTPTDARPFEFTYMEKTYVVQPVADYELRGLVVSHNNISAIDDIYHDSSSVDVRDICVVWGPNIKSDIYLRLKYSSEPFACFVQADWDTLRGFAKDALSNNHLLPANNFVKRAIQSVHIGDQIQFRGKLVNYYPRGASELTRRTSQVRTDTGDGACEIVFVDELEVLKPWRSAFYTLLKFSKRVILVSLLLQLLLFVITPYLEFRARGE